MTQSEWNSLVVGDRVYLITTNMPITVAEICTDERTLQKWVDKGYTGDRIIKLECFESEEYGDELHGVFNTHKGYHTWSIDWLSWRKYDTVPT